MKDNQMFQSGIQNSSMSYNIESDCECRTSDGALVLQMAVAKTIDQEKAAGEVLSLYKQMKLQEKFKKCTDLEKGFRESQMYTNGRLLNDIAQKIENQNINYPLTFQGLTDDQNTNTILTSIQLKSQHLNLNPLVAKP